MFTFRRGRAKLPADYEEKLKEAKKREEEARKAALLKKTL